MLNRRAFLTGCTGGAAAVALCSPALAAAVGVTMPAMVAIVDPSLSDSRAFADSLARRGARVLPTRPDLAQLWYDDLAPLLAGERCRIAGLTRSAEPFVLPRLARLRLLYQERHASSGQTGRLVSWVLG